MSKVWAFIASAFGILLIALKLKSNKIDKLEDENDALGDVVEITEGMTDAKNKLEKEAVDEKDSYDGSDWRDSI